MSPGESSRENESPLKGGLAAFGGLRNDDYDNEDDDFAFSLSSVKISGSTTSEDVRQIEDEAAKENEVMQRLTNKI